MMLDGSKNLVIYGSWVSWGWCWNWSGKVMDWDFWYFY